MTHDVDVLFPNNPHVTKLLKQLVDEVGAGVWIGAWTERQMV